MSPTESPTNLAQSPTPRGDDSIGVSLNEAIAIARSQTLDRDAALRSHAPGGYESVVQVLFGPGTPAETLPHPYNGRTLVWGLVFVTADEMMTIYLDLLTGDALYVEAAGRPDRLPEPHKSDIVFTPPILNVANSTTLDIELFINDIPAGTYAAGTSATIDPATVADPPWTVVARTSSGRELVTFNGHPKDVWHTIGDFPHSGTAIAGRADLSCGRLDIWAGFQPGGPAPGPSFPPHDCDP